MRASRVSSPKHPPNNRLTWERLQRGWSREELVEQIKQSMEEAGEKESGVNADVVRRWETGDRRPEPRYRKHLVLVFGLSASKLGLLSSDELASASGGDEFERQITVDDLLIQSMVKKAVRGLLGGDAEFGRDVFVRGLLGVSLAALLSNGCDISANIGALGAVRRGKLDPRSVDAFAAITRSHRELYWSSDPENLLQSVAAHVRLGAVMLHSMPVTEGHLSQSLASALTESALLAARLNFFDLARANDAEPFFELAASAANLSNDHALSASVFAHRAFVPGFAGNGRAARTFLTIAQGHARYSVGPLLRSWIHCVDAEVSARTGQIDVSLSRIRSAEDAIGTTGEDPRWLDYFDVSRLDGFAGNTLLIAGQHQDAAIRLERAVEALNESSAKQRSVLLFDLATAQASTDVERAIETAHRACDAAEAAPYATALQRLSGTRAAFSATPFIANLDERMNHLMARTGL